MNLLELPEREPGPEGQEETTGLNGYEEYNKKIKIRIKPLLFTLAQMYHDIYVEEEIIMSVDELVSFYYEEYVKELFPEKKQYPILKLLPVSWDDSSDSCIGQDTEKRMDLEVKLRGGDYKCVIRMSADNTLDVLHQMIQRATEFDNDHLYAFFVGKGSFKRRYIMAAFCERDEFAVEDTRLADLELRVKDTFSYLFDFGDMWWFDIKVLRIEEGTQEAPEIIKTVNDPPQQYPDFDEGEW